MESEWSMEKREIQDRGVEGAWGWCAEELWGGRHNNAESEREAGVGLTSER